MRNRIRALLTVLALATGVLLLGPAPQASAHGETAQESFLRMGTIAYWDVKFSKTDIKQGESVTLTGTAKVLETWPSQLASPKEGFISVVSPGPVVLIKDRRINGAPAPDAIEIQKGGVYNFSITLVGRRPGHWHVHPIFGVHGAGSLLGPGQYINVAEGNGAFHNAVTLASGKSIDLERYGMGNLKFWSIAWLIVGLAWLLYWIVPKPTVTRLPVTSQIPLNTDGMEYGLITKRDHRWMNVAMAVTLAMLVGGWVWQSSAYPHKMPQQVLHFAPAAAKQAPTFVSATIDEASYDEEKETVTADVTVTNSGRTAATLESFTTTTLTWPGPEEQIAVSPSATIAPMQTRKLTVKLVSDKWHGERLMPLNESRMQITGVMRFKDGAGQENFVTAQSFVKPTDLA